MGFCCIKASKQIASSQSLWNKGWRFTVATTPSITSPAGAEDATVGSKNNKPIVKYKSRFIKMFVQY